MTFGERAEYYVASTAAPAGGVIFALACGAIGGAVVATVYALLLAYVPIIGWISFILTGGFGVLAGFAISFGLNLGKIRNRSVALVVAAASATIAFYVAWVVWVWAIFDGAPLLEVANPANLFHSVLIINEKGAWSLKGFTPTGAVLWGLWGLEALIIYGCALVIGVSGSSSPFCEKCGDWCEETEGVRMFDADTGEENLRSRLETRDLSCLTETEPPQDDTHFYRVDLAYCTNCAELWCMSLVRVRITFDKDGDASTDTTDVVRHMLISREEAEALQA